MMMQPQLVIQDLEYLPCQRSSHCGEELSMVCLERKCVRDLLACPICEQDLHKQHRLVGLKEFLMGCLDKMGDQGPVLAEMLAIEAIKVSTLKQISGVRQSFLHEVYSLQQKVEAYFASLQEKLVEISAINTPQHFLKAINKINATNSTQQLNTLLTNYRYYCGPTSQRAAQYINNVTQNKIEASRKLIESLKVQETFQKVKQIFNKLKQPSLNPRYSWSDLKANKIEIDGLIATQTVSGSNGERFALMECLQKYQSEFVVGVRIRKLKGWIGVGICLRDQIVKAGYKFNYTQQFHGSYLISSNGYCWSHSKVSLNSTQNSFSFVEGDVVKITYSPSTQQVHFEKVNKALTFSMEVAPPPHHDSYVPCVNMCNPGDEVEIVNDFQ